MPRPQKAGIDYFPLDVAFFSDPKIKILKARYGVDGITVYIYLLCEIYRSGFYLQLNDDSVYIMSDDLKMSAEKVMQVLNFLLERSLFDNTLFQSDKVLTSAGIQRRFQLAVKERAKKNPVEIEGFWLLNEKETEPFIKVNRILFNSEKNEGYSGKNNNNSREKSLKESKEKESKEKDSKYFCPENGEDDMRTCYKLKTKDGTEHAVYACDIEKYQQLYPAVNIDREFRKMMGWTDANPKGRKPREGMARFINGWLGRSQDSSGQVGKTRKAAANQFQQFPQRDTDYDAIIQAQQEEMNQYGD